MHEPGIAITLFEIPDEGNNLGCGWAAGFDVQPTRSQYIVRWKNSDFNAELLAGNLLVFFLRLNK